MCVLKDPASLMEDTDMHIFVGYFLDGLFDSITEFNLEELGLGALQERTSRGCITSADR